MHVERLTLPPSDPLMVDEPSIRLEVARLIRQHQPRWISGAHS